ncbi:MAG: ABC transporter permease [Spirochaetia bacterium]
MHGVTKILKQQILGTLFVLVYLLYVALPTLQYSVLSPLFPHLQEILYPRASLLRLFGEHLLLVLLSGMSAFVTGIFLGIGVTRPWGREFLQPVQDLTALLQTFPPVAVLTLAVPAVGFGFTPAYLALFIYSILPIVRNTITGLLSVPQPLKEAARGMGMTPLQVLIKAELPQAFPAILTGTRISIIINIGTATIGGVIGAGGLGVAIVAGLVRDNTAFVLQGAIAAAGLAFLADYLFELWEQKMTRQE